MSINLPSIYLPRIPPPTYLNLQDLKKKYPYYPHVISASLAAILIGSYFLVKGRNFSNKQPEDLSYSDKKTSHHTPLKTASNSSTLESSPLSHSEDLAYLESQYKKRKILSAEEKTLVFDKLSSLWKTHFPTLSVDKQAIYLRWYQAFHPSRKSYTQDFTAATWKTIGDKHLSAYPQDLQEHTLRQWLKTMNRCQEEQTKQKMLIHLATFPLREDISSLHPMLIEAKLLSLEWGVYSYESSVFEELKQAKLTSYPPETQANMLQGLYLAAHYYIDVEKQSTKGYEILNSLSKNPLNPSVASSHYVKALFECAQITKEKDPLEAARLYRKCIDHCKTFDFEEKYHLLLVAYFQLATLQKSLNEAPEVWLEGYRYLAAQDPRSFSGEEKALFLQSLQALSDYYFSTSNYSSALAPLDRLLSLDLKETFPSHHYLALLKKVENYKRLSYSFEDPEKEASLKRSQELCYRQLHTLSLANLIQLLPEHEKDLLQASYDFAAIASVSRINSKGMRVTEASTSIQLLETSIAYMEKKPSLQSESFAKQSYFLYAELCYQGKGTSKDIQKAAKQFQKLCPPVQTTPTLYTPFELKSLFYLGDITCQKAARNKNSKEKSRLYQEASGFFRRGTKAKPLCDQDPLIAWKIRCQYRYALLLSQNLNQAQDAKRYFKKVADQPYEQIVTNTPSELLPYLDSLHQYIELCKNTPQQVDRYSLHDYLLKLANIPYFPHFPQNIERNAHIAEACFQYANVLFGLCSFASCKERENPNLALQFLQKAIGNRHPLAEERLKAYMEEKKY